jgi:hypothetical protein
LAFHPTWLARPGTPPLRLEPQDAGMSRMPSRLHGLPDLDGAENAKCLEVKLLEALYYWFRKVSGYESDS